nr:PLP-dependent aminotransferase family protein [bacterium]
MEKYTFASRMHGLSGNAIREIFKLLGQPQMISFAGGMPAPSTFRPQLVADITARLMAEKGIALLQYGATEGYAPLRESISVFLRHVGVELPESQVLPVSGSQQALDLLCKAFIDPGDCILVENPTFLGALHTMATYQADVKPVQSDENGVIPEALEEAILRYHPKLVYLIPTFQNPTGITLSLERRKAVADIAARTRTVIMEDDPYRDLRFAGQPLPAVASFNHDGYVVYLGSFSKLISPGMRVAFAAGAPEIIRKMTIGKQAADVHTPLLTQAIVDEMLRMDVLDGIMAEACKDYVVRLDAMLKALEGYPEGVSYTKPEGGLFVWAELPEGIDTLALLPEAAKAGVAYIPGTHFYCQGGHGNTMRLNFSNSTPERITQGMEILRGVIAGAMKG